jgi:hypothetical protein
MLMPKRDGAQGARVYPRLDATSSKQACCYADLATAPFFILCKSTSESGAFGKDPARDRIGFTRRRLCGLGGNDFAIRPQQSGHVCSSRE